MNNLENKLKILNKNFEEDLKKEHLEECQKNLIKKFEILEKIKLTNETKYIFEECLKQNEEFKKMIKEKMEETQGFVLAQNKKKKIVDKYNKY